MLVEMILFSVRGQITAVLFLRILTTLSTAISIKLAIAFSSSPQNLVMVAGAAIFALYEVSTALSVREQRRAEGTGQGPITKVAAKVRVCFLLDSQKLV